jgi:hypothetical protein
MRGRFGGLAWLALATSCASAGCIIPSYDMPAGFSSTYQRQLYGMDPTPTPVDGGLASLGTQPGIFYPITAFRDLPRTSNDTTVASTGNTPGPMVLGTDPFSPPPKVAKKPDDLGL